MYNDKITFLINELGLETEEQKEIFVSNLRIAFRRGIKWADNNQGGFDPVNKEIEDNL